MTKEFLLGPHGWLGVLQGFTACFSLLAAWAWMKSATLQKWSDNKDFLNRFSTDPATWNAAAAVCAAIAALAQGLFFLFWNSVP